ncbi:LacI family DNA-binding transcriptional regulator [Actinacidiphila alni]|uniref:LacI family DNA-binding transcriptional regulator n=1 Tax=Actinacidiphila alni TaxID=380248 RepID=UPI0033F5FAD5
MPSSEPGAAARSVPTIGSVAQVAGVSRATVSRAFTRPQMLRPETVEKVREAARQLGYVPNAAAKALSTGRFGNLAMVVPDIANPYIPPMISAVEEQAAGAGFAVFLGNSAEDPTREDLLVRRLTPQVDGFVLAASRMGEELIRQHARARPLVLVNRDIEGIPRVLIDTAGGVAQAVEHLAGLGHRRLAYLSGPSHSWANTQRRRAVRRTGDKLGIEVVTLPARLSSYEAGRQAAGALLDSGVTAVIAFDDLLAQGVLTGLAERNVRVPDEFSVAGCDDVLAAQTFPPLTTVSARAREAGATAVELLTSRLGGGSAMSDARVMLDTELVARATTGPRPQPGGRPRA